MTATPVKYTSLWHGLTSMLRDEGFTSLYKGLAPSLLGITHAAVQFPLYEEIKKRQSIDGNPTHLQLLGASTFSKVCDKIYSRSLQLLQPTHMKYYVHVFKHNQIVKSSIKESYKHLALYIRKKEYLDFVISKFKFVR